MRKKCEEAAQNRSGGKWKRPTKELMKERQAREAVGQTEKRGEEDQGIEAEEDEVD